MSLLAELQSRGVTTEDLEKAASVRLFEKAAAAEGVNLDNLSEDQVISLFEQFVSAPTSSTKEASAMNNEIVELFEKTAAAEGIDLDEMSDEDLAELYEHYVENVLPLQLDGGSEKEAAAQVFDLFQKTAAAEGIDLDEMSDDEIEGLYEHYVENVLPLQIGDEDAEEKVADAQEKLAEAEILGRHMARAYADEIDKVAAEAAEGETLGARLKRYGKTIDEKAQNFGRAVASVGAGEGVTRGGPKTHRAIGYGLPAVAAGGLAYGGKKLYDRKKGQTKKASYDYDGAVDELAIEMLRNAGYDV